MFCFLCNIIDYEFCCFSQQLLSLAHGIKTKANSYSESVEGIKMGRDESGIIFLFLFSIFVFFCLCY